MRETTALNTVVVTQFHWHNDLVFSIVNGETRSRHRFRSGTPRSIHRSMYTRGPEQTFIGRQREVLKFRRIGRVRPISYCCLSVHMDVFHRVALVSGRNGGTRIKQQVFGGNTARAWVTPHQLLLPETPPSSLRPHAMHHTEDNQQEQRSSRRG